MKNIKIIHHEFVNLGRQRNKLTYQLLSLLPKIYKENIYLKYRCATIYEYAGKYAGLSNSVVKKTLKLEESLEGKPHLREIIKTQGIHKVALIAKLATTETDETFAKNVENMSRNALQELSKELRTKRNSDGDDGDDDGDSNGRNFCQAAQGEFTIQLDPEMQLLFLKIKKRLEKEQGVGLSNKSAFKNMLEKINDACSDGYNESGVPPHESRDDKKFSGEKLGVSKEIPANGKRYISAKQKRRVLTKTNGKCTYPGCNKPSEHFHHRDRFSVSKNHNSIVPICKAHHEFAHNGLILNEKMEPDRWELMLERNDNGQNDDGGCNDGQARVYNPDKLYEKYRKKYLLSTCISRA
ncbi:hypothetical protein HOG48_04520 [Candidatus Peregrinibacteria bacterium]|jgi:hypothetical protein|nr:hypothetical protein [Candidatus Peregrinibacteria bacterium]